MDKENARYPEEVKAPRASALMRPLTESDFTERYLAWFRDPQVTRFLDARNISRDDAIAHLREGGAGERWALFAICMPDDNRHVGNIKIGPIQRPHMVSDLTTVIGDREAWGRGVARAAIRWAIEKAFRELGIRKLSASIDSLNLGSIKAYTAAGFHIEARLRDHFVYQAPDGLVLSDKLHVACFNPYASFDGGAAR